MRRAVTYWCFLCARFGIISIVYTLSRILYTLTLGRGLGHAAPIPSWGHIGVCDPAQWPTPVEVRGQTALRLLESLCLWSHNPQIPLYQCPSGRRSELSNILAPGCQLWLHVPRALGTKPSSPRGAWFEIIVLLLLLFLVLPSLFLQLLFFFSGKLLT